MNYGELKTAVLADGHRTDLATHIARFVREAEGMIRRELRAFPLSGTLTDANRPGVTSGVYTLPDGLLELRAVYRKGDDGDALEQVALSVIRRRSGAARPLQYAIRGKQIEVRGIPGAAAELEIEYLGHPAALVNDADTNELLDNHETLYKEAALFFLHKHCENVELAQGALDTFTDAVEKLNQQVGRKLGGASIAGAYNLFGCGGGY